MRLPLILDKFGKSCAGETSVQIFLENIACVASVKMEMLCLTEACHRPHHTSVCPSAQYIYASYMGFNWFSKSLR